MNKLRFSYMQLTCGEEETFRNPEKTYERLKRNGYDAIELTPPKGRYGKGISIESYLETCKKLLKAYDLEVSCVNEAWGAEWDPYSPQYKTFTDSKGAELALQETRSSIDFASEVQAPFVTIALATHQPITVDMANDCTKIAVETLQKMSEYAEKKDVRLVFEATNHLEMGKFVNTARNHKRMIELSKCKNIGIQLDWFHANFEELNPYEAAMDAYPWLWHMHFRDSNSLTPGYGSLDFKAVIRAVKMCDYKGYCTIESAPMVPTIEDAFKDGIEYLRLLEKIVDFQLSPEYPNGFAISL